MYLAKQGGDKVGLTFTDIFCGMGTIRMGFEKAGHECGYSIEWDKSKRLIYETIFGHEPEGRDIRDTRASDIPRTDCWCFGFPCTDISIAGEYSQEQLGLSGERSGLFYEVMRLLKETRKEDRPKYLFAENVKNLLSINKGWDFFNLLHCMDEIGYDAEWDVINAADIMSQNRERTFIIGHLRGSSTKKYFLSERAMNYLIRAKERGRLRVQILSQPLLKNMVAFTPAVKHTLHQKLMEIWNF